MWKFNKKIEFKDTLILLLMPLMGLHSALRQSLQIPQLGFEGLIFGIVAIVAIYFFYKKNNGGFFHKVFIINKNNIIHAIE